MPSTNSFTFEDKSSIKSMSLIKYNGGSTINPLGTPAVILLEDVAWPLSSTLLLSILQSLVTGSLPNIPFCYTRLLLAPLISLNHQNIMTVTSIGFPGISNKHGAYLKFLPCAAI